MKFDDVLSRRQSIRRYATKNVSFNAVSQIINAGIQTPMAGNIFTLRFIIVQEQAKRQELASASGQDFIAQAPWVIVVCSDNARVYNAYDERGLRYSRQQAGAAIENMLLKITDLGLASCWIGAFDDEAVKNICAIPQEIEVEALIPVAYGTKFIREQKRTKPQVKQVIYFERWKQTMMRPLKKPAAGDIGL